MSGSGLRHRYLILAIPVKQRSRQTGKKVRHTRKQERDKKICQVF